MSEHRLEGLKKAELCRIGRQNSRTPAAARPIALPPYREKG